MASFNCCGVHLQSQMALNCAFTFAPTLDVASTELAVSSRLSKNLSQSLPANPLQKFRNPVRKLRPAGQGGHAGLGHGRLVKNLELVGWCWDQRSFYAARVGASFSTSVENHFHRSFPVQIENRDRPHRGSLRLQGKECKFKRRVARICDPRSQLLPQRRASMRS